MNRIPPFLRWLTAGLAAVVVLTGLFVVKGDGQRAALPASITASPEPTSKTHQKILRLLVLISDAQGAIQGAAILSRTSDSRTLRIYNVDPQVAVDLGNQGIRALSETDQDTYIDNIQLGVEVATGIPIDGTLRLAQLTVAGLVDSIGGISINSPKGFLVSGLDANPIYVPEGISLLSGKQAADYATFVETNAAESDRISRMNQVLSAMFQALPVDEKRLNEILESLGATAGTNVPTADVASMLADVSKALAWPVMAARTLPSVSSDLAQSVTTSWLRIERTQTQPIGRAMETSNYSTKVPAVTVMVSGGLAPDRLKLRDQLQRNGFSFIDGGNPGLEMQTVISASSTLDPAKLALVLPALGFDITWQSRVVLSEDPTADVVVTLGSDFITFK